MTEYKQVIVIRSDLNMGKGKIGAQSAHAALDAAEKSKTKNSQWYNAWKETGQAKVVLKIDSEQKIVELFEHAKRELPASLIRDAGRTQVEPGSITAIAIGPAPSDKIDKYTKELKLL